MQGQLGLFHRAGQGRGVGEVAGGRAVKEWVSESSVLENRVSESSVTEWDRNHKWPVSSLLPLG